MQPNSDQDVLDLENLRHAASDATTLEKQREKLELQLVSVPTTNDEQLDKGTVESDATIKAASIDDIHPENVPSNGNTNSNGDRTHGAPTKVSAFTN